MRIHRVALASAVSISLISSACTSTLDDEAAGPVQTLPPSRPLLVARQPMFDDAPGALPRCYEQTEHSTSNEYFGLTLDEAHALATEVGDHVDVMASEGGECGPIWAMIDPTRILVTVMNGKIHTATRG